MPYSLTSQNKPAETPAADRHAERPLRLLIAASIVIPLAIFLVAAWISYNQHVAEATERL